ncbi:MAG: tRNA (adenosine(37)-N6)-threonylcarbamoyltransferase complex transferase subunit TsaD [Holosporaceae bacterium]|jgi:N6-L-threonylcarbamoyladenine synthase|nr:tRNA (adenosine(37)-N6)-threonylcarbamoyltransferase complex transferase subunit TsaD [Holosporaceae bacterium]
MLVILGIESSCDETAAAVVTGQKNILSNVVYSQMSEHQPFGGVVPEVAARAHLEKIDIVVQEALRNAGLDMTELDAVAATCGPGLIGGIIVGATLAKSIAMCLDIPFLAINHIEAHAISVRLTGNVEFPYLLLLASGGHCQLWVVYAIDNFEVIGKTLDDSVGEAFDKIAKIVGLGYPGGPLLERISQQGNAARFRLPLPLCKGGDCDFSFSGLKTATKVVWEKYCRNNQDRCDLCASFQQTVVNILVYKMNAAITICRERNISISAAVVAGGVAANGSVRAALQALCHKSALPFCAPPVELCTDNAAMVAWLGVEKFRKRQYATLDFAPYPREPQKIG